MILVVTFILGFVIREMTFNIDYTPRVYFLQAELNNNSISWQDNREDNFTELVSFNITHVCTIERDITFFGSKITLKSDLK